MMNKTFIICRYIYGDTPLYTPYLNTGFQVPGWGSWSSYGTVDPTTRVRIPTRAPNYLLEALHIAYFFLTAHFHYFHMHLPMDYILKSEGCVSYGYS
jgi:hypothetical protein